MDTVKHPRAPGSSRTVPRRLGDEQRDRLRSLLDDPSTWVLRPGWLPFLLDGDLTRLVPTDDLTRDQQAAGLAWLRQQRHALYRALEGGDVAPDGWLEGFAMVRRLQETGLQD